jgi:ABC-type branched-subunit amino acid transport system substrate-binding protein
MGLNQPVYTSDRVVSEEFLGIAGPLAEGIKTTCQYNPDSGDPKLKAFQENYQKRFGQKPDVFAAHAYDGMNILLDAVKKAGLNRALIRDLLTDMKTFNGYDGVTGKVIFDGTWNNVRPIYLASVKNGKFEFKPAPQLEKSNEIYKHSDGKY